MLPYSKTEGHWEETWWQNGTIRGDFVLKVAGEGDLPHCTLKERNLQSL